jgi:hypothetical protein
MGALPNANRRAAIDSLEPRRLMATLRAFDIEYLNPAVNFNNSQWVTTGTSVQWTDLQTLKSARSANSNILLDVGLAQDMGLTITS